MTVTTLSEGAAALTRVAPATAAAPRIEAFARIEDCEALWRRFQDRGIATPFQRFDWIAAFLHSRPADETETRVLLATNGAGEPTMLLPLAIERRLGLRIAAPIGGKQANYKMPILTRDPGRAAPDWPALLVEAGPALGIDIYQFLAAPLNWAGEANPLAELGRPSPSNAFRLDLAASGEETLSRVLERGARKKLRQKEKWLARLGRVEGVEAVDRATIDHVLDAFFRQKSERLRRQGIADPFSCEHTRAFLREGCLAQSVGQPAAIELHALMLEGAPVAVFAGAVDRERMSGMVISFEASDEIARCSPGDLLIARVIEAQCRRGRRVFDLGVGEARYKRSFCDGVEPLVDIMIPVTEGGRLYGAAARLAMDAKRFVKQTSWTMRLLSTMRRSAALFT